MICKYVLKSYYIGEKNWIKILAGIINNQKELALSFLYSICEIYICTKM